VVLVNHCWDVTGHPRGFPKWYIRKYSVWHFLRNRPIVEISGDFHNKLSIFIIFCLTFRTFWPIVAENRVESSLSRLHPSLWSKNLNFWPKNFFFSKSCFVSYFDRNRLYFALFYEIIVVFSNFGSFIWQIFFL
jgi:hypothetical protein